MYRRLTGTEYERCYSLCFINVVVARVLDSSVLQSLLLEREQTESGKRLWHTGASNE
jgi:hypothetical protein